MPDVQRVAIIGAGLAGLTCARVLADAGLSVTVFDKGRVPGGRMSTRVTSGGLTFDHGAQYFTVRDRRFKARVGVWERRGVATPWKGVITTLGDATAGPPPQSERWVGSPHMSALCRDLAGGLRTEVICRVRVSAIERDGSGKWTLAFADNELRGDFDAVVIAIPAEQAFTLTPPNSSIRADLARVKMLPCWAVMAAVDRSLETEFDAAFVRSGPLSWIARSSSKPGRDPAPERWVLHASPKWSKQNLEAEESAVAGDLLAAFAAIVDRPVAPHAIRAHRWRYAQADEPLDYGSLWDSALSLGACGDWCAGSRVEGAYLSGLSMAESILGKKPGR